MTYWRIRANPEEFENMKINQKVQICLREKKIIVGHPRNLAAFKEQIQKGDIFITRDETQYYIGRIASDCVSDPKDKRLFYREVEWLDEKGKLIETPSLLFPQGIMQTCTRLDPKAEAIVRERLKNM